MEVIFIVLPLALVLAGVALAAFLWAVRRGQYDDLDAPEEDSAYFAPTDPVLGRDAGDNFEVVGGFAILRANSKEEAIQLAKDFLRS